MILPFLLCTLVFHGREAERVHGTSGLSADTRVGD